MPAATANTAIQDYRAQLKAELATLRQHIPAPGGNKISLKGKMFGLPDGSSNAGPIACVILDWRYENQYYTGVFNAAKPEPPVCWSITSDAKSMTPSDSVPKPKSEDCASCDFNQFGSAATGRGKACKNQRRLAVVPADATADSDVMILQVSPTGLKNFDNYVNGIVAGDQFPIEVVTHIGFNPKESYPTLVFGAPESLSDERLGTMMALKAKAQSSLDREPEVRT
jgi:hypothetical protein